jgi:hypothetical protein
MVEETYEVGGRRRDVGIKEKMMHRMIDKMSFEEKKMMMESMMEKFMDSLSPEEKKAMMMKMMPGMMQGMMGDVSEEGGSPMMGMMRMMMGRESPESDGDESGSSPMDMCKKMMESISASGETAAFATPELRSLFGEWCAQVEEEILRAVKENGSTDPDTIADKVKLSRESVVYLITKLAREKRLNLSIVPD